MSFFTRSQKISVQLDDALADKLDQTIPRSLKLSVLIRWLLRGLVLDKVEIAQYCRDNPDEASAVQPFLHDCFSKIFDAIKTVKNE